MRIQRRVFQFWISHSFWFVPTSMTLAAGLLAIGAIFGDRHLPPFHWPFHPGIERTTLEMIAASMITVAGVVFSVTLVAFSLVSSQFGPRVLPEFMRDRGNQVVMGVFIATFAYCLIALQGIRETDAGASHPLTILGALVLAFCCIGVFIYFIHHVSESIQIDRVVATTADELLRTIDEVYPHPADIRDREPSEAQRDRDYVADSHPIPSQRGGYVQVVDEIQAVRLAQKHDCTIEIFSRPGDFVSDGDPLAYILRDSAPDLALVREINHLFVIGVHRTPMMDIVFDINLLAQIALRGLSPAVNDPVSAQQCIDRLGQAISRLAGRAVPDPARRDDRGTVRVIIYPVTFTQALELAFEPVRIFGGSNPFIIEHVLKTMSEIVGNIRDQSHLTALDRIAQAYGATDRFSEELDKNRVDRAFRVYRERSNRKEVSLSTGSVADSGAKPRRGADR